MTERKSIEERIRQFWFGNDVHQSAPVEKVNFWYADPSDPKWLEIHGEALSYIEDNFLFLVKSALSGALDDWQKDARASLSLVLLLDQFAPRLLHGEDHIRKCRELSLRYCRQGIAHGFDKSLTPLECCFYYGPLLHAEKLSLRTAGVRLLETLLETLKFEENPYHKQRNLVTQYLYHSVAQKTRAEKDYLSYSV